MTIEFVPQVEDKLSPIERLEALCDDGSLTLLRSDVRSRRMGEKARAGDGVIAGAGRVDGRPVFCYAQDPSYLGGSLGEQHADSIVRVLRLAGRAGAPVVGFIESGGARMQEGLAALAGYARIFKEHVALSGKVPQISVICGASAGGGSYSPALTDFVVMTERGNMFLTGPAVVKDVMGEDVDAFDLGGPKVHDRNGVAHFVARTDSDAALLVRDLLDHLPSHAGAPAPMWRSSDPPGYDPGDPVPESERMVYDVRDVVRGTVDGGRLLEWGPRWARNIVCGFARMEGKPVGIIANQPQLSRRRARRGVGVQGREVRAHLQRVRPPAARVRRHARLHARHQAGARRRHPPRRQARARVRRGERAEGDDRAAQGVRRCLHRDELARPRRGLRLRVAAGDARRDGRQAGRGDRQPARHRRGRRPGGRARRVRRRVPRRAPHLGGRRRGGLRGRDRPAGRHAPSPHARRCARSRRSRIPRTA